MERQRFYVCIDIKSFYASVECVERGLDPMTTKLVVADPERSDKTICLAVSPMMKKLGVHNRCRLFEIPGSIEYIIAPPRMQKYIDYAAKIYDLFLDYVSADDIHVYSVDESFLDVTAYLERYRMDARQMAKFLMDKIETDIGLRSTAGVGTNLYLAKIALDITAKHAKDFIGYLDEALFKEKLWDHRPLTDFWRIGRGIEGRLAHLGIYTMRQLAEADEDILYKTFGIDAELMIDHAYGREITTMKDIHSYKSKNKCLSNGQVLMRDYSFEETEIVLKEMIDALCQQMVEKGLVTKNVSFYVGYAGHGNGSDGGSFTLLSETSRERVIIPEVMKLYHSVVDRNLKIRRLGVGCNVVPEASVVHQISLFDEDEANERDRKVSEAVLSIKKKFGKNALLKGMDLQEGATARERNEQIGGHKRG